MMIVVALLFLVTGVLIGAWLPIRANLTVLTKLEVMQAKIRKDQIALTKFLRDEIRDLKK